MTLFKLILTTTILNCSLISLTAQTSKIDTDQFLEVNTHTLQDKFFPTIIGKLSMERKYSPEDLKG
jgi:hypothetical protein